MAYWWVSQNRTFEHESKDGYLWAPLKGSDGETPYHWKNMELVSPGDVVFSYVGQSIAAVSVALGKALEADRPSVFEAEGIWEMQGLRLSARYLVLPDPIKVRSLPPSVIGQLQGKYMPLDVNGEGKQAYLFGIPPESGRQLLGLVEEALGFPIDFHEATQPGSTDLQKGAAGTEREALVKSRIGQGKFRDDLLKLWKSKCCVIGLSIEPLLRASHIKPWKDSNDFERLDPFNGLPLSPALDAAFDAGLVTFGNDGLIQFSSKADADQLELIGVSAGLRVHGLVAAHTPYLEHHRSHVFVK